MFATIKDKVIPIHLVQQENCDEILNNVDSRVANILCSQHFQAKIGQYVLVYDPHGYLAEVYVGVQSNDMYALSDLPLQLPEATYVINDPSATFADVELELGWGLGCYQFTKYQDSKRDPAKLVPRDHINIENVQQQLSAIFLVRDLINTPTEDLGPSELSFEFKKIAKKFDAKFKEIVGKQLLKENFPLVHAVGRACDDEPRLFELVWGDKKHKSLTLVGKGVCFDTGGLDLKSAAGMLAMKKDMGGAANVLGLAYMIMAAKLPVYLRVIVPAVENSVSANSVRPSDIIRSRSGLTVEIGNTDAEGRLILADALAYAAEANPDWIIDFATLTGAARVALGTEIPAIFNKNADFVHELLQTAVKKQDPIWPLPLHDSYRRWMDSDIADICNMSQQAYGGALTAALFLREFVPNNIEWTHIDLMAANIEDLPGRPKGGEAQAIRTLFAWLQCIL